MSSSPEGIANQEGQEVIGVDDFSEAARLSEEFQRAHGIEPLNRQAEEVGLYPDIDDDRFLAKLLAKREFRESKQSKITNEMLKEDICSVQEFEYTPVQRFVAQFMSPTTPYNGMLLYHGVGVGKTCTAVLTAESFLELSPKNKVYILAPPAIQAGFYRTIFDSSRIVFGVDETSINQHEGCTGNRYLELTQTLYEREKKDIELRVNRLINKRYSIMGYVAFRNMVNEILSVIPSTLNPIRKREQEVRLLQRAFSGCLFVVDEAHNMRDVVDVNEEVDQIDDTGADERGDASAGKKLAPTLRKVLKTCDGNKLLLMTATPMYNSYKEIISLLNFLLDADHADPSKYLTDDKIKFEIRDPAIGEQLTLQSEKLLIDIANGHVSFMRGENPRAFPARLDPPDEQRIVNWPAFAPNGTVEIKPDQQKKDVIRLPLVKCELVGDSLEVIKSMTEKLVAAKGVGIRTIDTLLQAGNCIFPGEGLEARTGTEGFQTFFRAQAIPGSFEGTRLSMLPQYVPAQPESYAWMAIGKNTLGRYSPKFNQILTTIKNASGISFVYSRFVESGAVIFCLLLEANGYTPWGRSAPLFSSGPVTPGGRQCAKCNRRESGHPAPIGGQEESYDNHKFTPAYYALLTASDISTVQKESIALSPNNTRVINEARDKSNFDGSKIKVIVGSQVAGEGLDLKAIREIHILEGWFHLSKEEQIVGRGIRYCSHQGLKKEFRNCTVNLYVNVFPQVYNKETIDQYSYRTAMNKAVRVGNVSRALKQGAADCNLNRDAILVDAELDDVKIVNSQRVENTISLRDRDYTPICDWITCNYECKPTVDLKTLDEDTSTYDLYTARFAEQKMLYKLKRLFVESTWLHWNDVIKIFKDIPKATLTSLLMRTVNNPSIVFKNGDMEGHLIYKNNLFIFQPNNIHDEAIPIALRHGRYPIKRDEYEPEEYTTAPTATILRKAPLASVVPATAGPATATTAAPGTTAATTALVPNRVTTAVASQFNIELASNFWKQATQWLDSWAADGTAKASIVERVDNTLSATILAYVNKDYVKRENIEARLKKLQWWGKSVADVKDGLSDLRSIGREFIWDSFLKGQEQAVLITSNTDDTAGSEQQLQAGQLKAVRFLDIVSREPVYVCNGSACPPSVLQIFTGSKTDPVVNAVANQRVSAEVYGFMVPWENAMMFKTNEPKPEGKEPGGGAACAIVSNVKGHRMKLITLGEILARYNDGNNFDLTEDKLTNERKLQGAPNFCALMEIVMRWMDKRRANYGGLRYFYRPLSAYYSKHKGKK